MKRRDIFKAVPAASLLAMPAIASSQGPIMTLFRQWQAAMSIANDKASTDAVSEKAIIETQRLEDLIASHPAMTAQDVAAKIIAWTDDNNLSLDGRGSDVIWTELRALVA